MNRDKRLFIHLFIYTSDILIPRKHTQLITYLDDITITENTQTHTYNHTYVIHAWTKLHSLLLNITLASICGSTTLYYTHTHPNIYILNLLATNTLTTRQPNIQNYTNSQSLFFDQLGQTLPTYVKSQYLIFPLHSLSQSMHPQKK